MRKRTIRRMTPRARMLAKLSNELQSINRRLKNVIGLVQDLEQVAGAQGPEWFEKGGTR